MTTIAALGSGPVGFVDANGKQYSIPLSFISYSSAAGTPAISSSWPGWNPAPAPTSPAQSEQSVIGNWVSLLGTLGLISPAPLPPASPSFTVTAASPGSAGNDITINFTTLNNDGTLNVTVSTTQVYKGLNYDAAAANAIETVLGTTPSNGTAPGLAYVSGTPNAVPNATSGAVNFTANAGTYEFDLPGTTSGVLTASNNPTSADAGLITAAISNVNTTDGTFDLTLSWSKPATSVTPATLGSQFSYLITVAAPSGGFGPAPAVPSSVTLVGGANASSSAAAAASATVISG
jgi:hypothetical protein